MTPFQIKWQAPEFKYRPKSISWYWISIILAVILLGAAVWQKNFFFGFFVVAAEILILIWANREPPLVEFSLNEKGLSVGGREFHAYTEIESFSADEEMDAEWPDLFFQFRRRLKPVLKIKAPKNQMAEIQNALKAVLPQIKHEQSLLDALEEFIGF